ncbi:hypothetical protein ITJ38_02780 [Agreia pratensis]|uniref:hypothetical protein n=1 Tax=Agreia pratensis TaxID=150121 RepID=UPI00188B5E07|nr:hypothetical protein [Agreia pratensis]MBF4633323.1 hypothetical protein [Agreia pratensis]
MRAGKLCATALIVVTLVGVSGCVQEPPRPGVSEPASTGSTAPPTPRASASPTPTTSTPPSDGSTPPPANGGSTGGQPANADVQILDARFDPGASAISVAGMVVNVVSDAGLCTATASQDNVSVSATASGVADASVTYCASLVMSLPAGSSGEWSVSLAYDEGSAHGTTVSKVVVG